MRERMSEPFLDDSIMDDSPPSCASEDFEAPRLRRCPFDIRSMSFTGRINSTPDPVACTGLDGGLDGYNWKVRFEEGGPTFVLKVVGRLPAF